ncbi:MAG TPA: hypothetical protein PLW44_07610 [Chitinophagales bacterium]|nr:hypothetical protein [Chitinophagales bacterium]
MLGSIIACAELLGLPKVDILAAKDFLDYNELELCLDQVATQLYEYNIEVTPSFVGLVEFALQKMKLPPSTHAYLNELIINESSIPHTVTLEIDAVFKQYQK